MFTQSINTASSIPDLQLMHHNHLHTKAIVTANDTIKYAHIYGIHRTHFDFVPRLNIRNKLLKEQPSTKNSIEL